MPASSNDSTTYPVNVTGVFTPPCISNKKFFVIKDGANSKRNNETDFKSVLNGRRIVMKFHAPCGVVM